MSETEPKTLSDDLFLVRVQDAESGKTSETLSFSRSPTVLINFAANRFTRETSRIYQSEFGLSVMDWRMIVMLMREPGATAARASETIGIDKAAVSRSIRRLSDSELIYSGKSYRNGRSHGWHLTDKGETLHAAGLKRALERQKSLLEGFSAEEVTVLCDLLQRFLANLEFETTD